MMYIQLQHHSRLYSFIDVASQSLPPAAILPKYGRCITLQKCAWNRFMAYYDTWVRGENSLLLIKSLPCHQEPALSRTVINNNNGCYIDAFPRGRGQEQGTLARVVGRFLLTKSTADIRSCSQICSPILKGNKMDGCLLPGFSQRGLVSDVKE